MIDEILSMLDAEEYPEIYGYLSSPLRTAVGRHRRTWGMCITTDALVCRIMRKHFTILLWEPLTVI